KEYVENGVWSSVLFENTTVGTLTTDHVRVYAVEDFTVPPPTPLGGRKVDSVEQKLKDAADHNRLQAYELESGKLLWEIGSKAEDKEPKGLEDIFFLGPPLPLQRKLYVLAEKKEGLCLLTLAPATGKILTSRLLGKVHDRIPENPRRRINAAPLAHAEGILVCPTNAGAVLGFDLASNRLLWAHAYRDKGDSYAALSDPRFGPPPPGKIYLADGRLVSADLRVAAWAAAGPIIDSGRVIFTAPDSVWLRCLSLRDGRMLWKYQRHDGDLYV